MWAEWSVQCEGTIIPPEGADRDLLSLTEMVLRKWPSIPRGAELSFVQRGAEFDFVAHWAGSRREPSALQSIEIKGTIKI